MTQEQSAGSPTGPLTWSRLDAQKQQWQNDSPPDHRTILPSLPLMGAAVVSTVNAVAARGEDMAVQHAMLALHRVYVPTSDLDASVPPDAGGDSEASVLMLIMHARALACYTFGYLRAGIAAAIGRVADRLFPLVRLANPDDGLGDAYYGTRRVRGDAKNVSNFSERAMQWYRICNSFNGKPGSLGDVVSNIAAACNASGLSCGVAERETIVQCHPGSTEASLHGPAEAARAFFGPTEEARIALGNLCRALSAHADWQSDPNRRELEDGGRTTFQDDEEMQFVRALAAVADQVWSLAYEERSHAWGLAANTAELLRDALPDAGLALRKVVADYYAGLDPTNVEVVSSEDSIRDSENRIAEYSSLVGIENLDPKWALAALLFGNPEVSLTVDVAGNANACVLADAYGRLQNARVSVEVDKMVPIAPNPYLERVDRSLRRLFGSNEIQRHGGLAADPMWWPIVQFLETDCAEARTVLARTPRWPELREKLKTTDREYRKAVAELACDPRRFWMDPTHKFFELREVQDALARLGKIADEATAALNELRDAFVDAPRVISLPGPYLVGKRGITPRQVAAAVEMASLRCDDVEYLQQMIQNTLSTSQDELEGGAEYEQQQRAALPAPPASYLASRQRRQQKRPNSLAPTGAGFCDALTKGTTTLAALKRRIGNQVLLGESTDVLLRKLRLTVPGVGNEGVTLLRDKREEHVPADDLRRAYSQLQALTNPNPCQVKMQSFFRRIADDLPAQLRYYNVQPRTDPPLKLLQTFQRVFDDAMLDDPAKVFPDGVMQGDLSKECDSYQHILAGPLAGFIQEGLPMRVTKPSVEDVTATPLGYAILLGNAALIYAVLSLNCDQLQEYAKPLGKGQSATNRHRKMLLDVAETGLHGRARVALATEAKVIVNYYTNLYAESSLIVNMARLATSTEGFSAYELLGMAARCSQAEYLVRRAFMYLIPYFLPTRTLSSMALWVKEVVCSFGSSSTKDSVGQGETGNSTVGNFTTTTTTTASQSAQPPIATSEWELRASEAVFIREVLNDNTVGVLFGRDRQETVLAPSVFAATVTDGKAIRQGALDNNPSLNKAYTERVVELTEWGIRSGKNPDAARQEAETTVSAWLYNLWNQISRYTKATTFGTPAVSTLELYAQPLNYPAKLAKREIDIELAWKSMVPESIREALSVVKETIMAPGSSSSSVENTKNNNTTVASAFYATTASPADVAAESELLDADAHMRAQFYQSARGSTLRLSATSSWELGCRMLNKVYIPSLDWIPMMASGIDWLRDVTRLSSDAFSWIPTFWLSSVVINLVVNSQFGPNDSLARYAKYKAEFLASYPPSVAAPGSSERLIEAAARAGLELCTFELPTLKSNVGNYASMLASVLTSTAVTATQTFVLAVLTSSITPIGYVVSATVLSQVVAAVSGRLQPYVMTTLAKLFRLPPDVLLDHDFASTLTGRLFATRQSKFSFSPGSYKIIQEALEKAFSEPVEYK